MARFLGFHTSGFMGHGGRNTQYPDYCRRLDKGKYPDYVEYEIDKDRLSVRLLPPMSEEKRKAASVQAKANGLGKRRME